MNTKVGFWSAFGALVGGVVGATSAKYVSEARPRYRYAEKRYAQQKPAGGGRKRIGTEIEDAMVIGGSAGALLGAFMGAAASAPEELPPPPQLPR